MAWVKEAKDAYRNALISACLTDHFSASFPDLCTVEASKISVLQLCAVID